MWHTNQAKMSKKVNLNINFYLVNNTKKGNLDKVHVVSNAYTQQSNCFWNNESRWEAIGGTMWPSIHWQSNSQTCQIPEADKSTSWSLMLVSKNRLNVISLSSVISSRTGPLLWVFAATDWLICHCTCDANEFTHLKKAVKKIV